MLGFMHFHKAKSANQVHGMDKSSVCCLAGTTDARSTASVSPV